MKKIISPKFKDYFNISGDYKGKEAFFYYEVQNFNKFNMFLLFIVLNGVIGIYHKEATVVCLSTIIYFVFNYLKLRSVAHNVNIVRSNVVDSIEGALSTYTYKLKNKSSFSLIEYKIMEDFKGGTLQKGKLQRLRANDIAVIKSKILFDKGFGEFEFEKIIIELHDDLAIFKFKVEIVQKQKILVYPKLQNFYEVEQKNNQDSYLSGDYEIFQKGVSPNFFGLRQYNYGDPVKHINWKISQKIRETVVNEYENAVNLKVNYILNFSNMAHMGIGHFSTWEYARDLCLSLATNDIKKSHILEIFSNDFHIPEGSGQNFLNYTEMKLCYLKPKSDPKAPVIINDVINRTNKGQALIYITPLVYDGSLVKNIELIKNNGSYFSSINIFLIDPFSKVKTKIPEEFHMELMSLKKSSYDFYKRSIEPLRNLKISIHIVNIKEPHMLIKQSKQVMSL